MGLKELIGELQRDAQDKADGIREAAQAEAAAILQATEREIAERSRARLDEQEEQEQTRARSEVASARQEALRQVLDARARLIGRVFDRTRALLGELSDSERYRKTVPGSVRRALEFVEGEQAIVRCSESNVRAMRAALKGITRVKVESDAEVANGFVLTDEAGTVTIDEQLEARLSRLEPALAIEIVGQLETG